MVYMCLYVWYVYVYKYFIDPLNQFDLYLRQKVTPGGLKAMSVRAITTKCKIFNTLPFETFLTSVVKAAQKILLYLDNNFEYQHF